jgi:hypothetical protein
MRWLPRSTRHLPRHFWTRRRTACASLLLLLPWRDTCRSAQNMCTRGGREEEEECMWPGRQASPACHVSGGAEEEEEERARDVRRWWPVARDAAHRPTR